MLSVHFLYHVHVYYVVTKDVDASIIATEPNDKSYNLNDMYIHLYCNF